MCFSSHVGTGSSAQDVDGDEYQLTGVRHRSGWECVQQWYARTVLVVRTVTRHVLISESLTYRLNLNPEGLGETTDEMLRVFV